MRADAPRTSFGMVACVKSLQYALRQLDDRVDALDAVIHRDLKDRIAFLDPFSCRLRRFVCRVGAFRLPIHPQVKSAAVVLLALRDRLRGGFRRRGRHGDGLAPSSLGRHGMISSASRLVAAVLAAYCAISNCCWRRSTMSHSARSHSSGGDVPGLQLATSQVAGTRWSS